jgi:hypothetical protein
MSGGKITAVITWIVVSLLAFACSGVRANDARCDAPPYGDSQQNYAAMYSHFGRVAAADANLPAKILTGHLRTALIETCKAKFQRGSRASYYRNRISDADIDAASTTALADAWFRARNAALAKEMAPPPEEDYSRIYALFECIRATEIMCRLSPASRYTFNTLSDCQQYARMYAPQGPDAQGRFVMTGNFWFECRSKHVDAWEPAR